MSSLLVCHFSVALRFSLTIQKMLNPIPGRLPQSMSNGSHHHQPVPSSGTISKLSAPSPPPTNGTHELVLVRVIQVCQKTIQLHATRCNDNPAVTTATIHSNKFNVGSPP